VAVADCALARHSYRKEQLNFTRSIVAKSFGLSSVSTVNEGPSRGILVKVVVQISYVHQMRWVGDLKERSIEDKI